MSYVRCRHQFVYLCPRMHVGPALIRVCRRLTVCSLWILSCSKKLNNVFPVWNRSSSLWTPAMVRVFKFKVIHWRNTPPSKDVSVKCTQSDCPTGALRVCLPILRRRGIPFCQIDLKVYPKRSNVAKILCLSRYASPLVVLSHYQYEKHSQWPISVFLVWVWFFLSKLNNLGLLLSVHTLSTSTSYGIHILWSTSIFRLWDLSFLVDQMSIQ